MTKNKKHLDNYFNFKIDKKQYKLTHKFVVKYLTKHNKIKNLV